MTLGPTAGQKSFVLFALGKRRFALPAGSVAELVGSSHLHKFRHSNPLLLGVLLRRGRIVPVWDVTRILGGANASTRKFYLIAKQRFGPTTEWTALPVTGQCEILAGLEPFPSSDEHPPYVDGLLILVEEVVEVLDLEKLAAAMYVPAPAADSTSVAEVRV
jgi:chemotaxis signal transduction protein